MKVWKLVLDNIVYIENRVQRKNQQHHMARKPWEVKQTSEWPAVTTVLVSPRGIIQ